MKQRMLFTLRPDSINQDVPAIMDTNIPPDGKHIGHVAMYTDGNAGDTLLPRTVRDAIDRMQTNHWTGIHAHRVVNRNLLNEINKLDGLLIGGGGLFLRDTNPNNRSGWQWSCSVETLKSIKTPIALFAVGYNRFRGQKDFRRVFVRHLERLADQCVYMGMRNTGSMNAVKSYLPESLHHKVRFQPCPTTLCSQLYPDICSIEPEQPTIAINCAFDRIDLRLGNRKEEILNQLAEAAKTLSADAKIEYFSHAKSDEQMLPYLEQAGVPYTLRKLYYIPPREVVEAYSRITVTIGMRGHAQMVPFGCGTPIISLISHDKVRWFLEDIGQPEWGIEMTSPDFKTALISKAIQSMKDRVAIQNSIASIQVNLLKTTLTNATNFLQQMK
jgi:polysaccharide pyruvyl transferase WcaK-like protein